MKIRLARLTVFLFALAFPILSGASEISPKPANFALAIINGTSGDIWIKGPVAYEVAGAPAFTCQKVESNSWNVLGPFTWESGDSGWAMYSIWNGGQCNNSTNQLVGFKFSNWGSKDSSDCSGNNLGWFNTIGVNLCVSVTSQNSSYVYGVGRTVDPNGSGLPVIVVQIGQ